MITKVQKWGNSQGLRFSKEILRKVHISIGDEVYVSVKHGKIVIGATAQVRGKYKLEALIAKMPSEYKPQEEDWGRTAGREVW